MTVHIVLYRPKPGIDSEARQRFINALVAARRDIEAVRRFWVGRRIANGPPYQLGDLPDYPYAAVVEFDDRAGLIKYLSHPAHIALGREFGASVESALVYDYDAVDASAAEFVVDE
jgi:hypothetical protein